MGGGKKSKKKKTKTKAQKMAVANKAKYGGTAKAAAANKKSMQNKAKSYTKSYGAASTAAANKAANKVAAGKRYQTSLANKALSKAGGTSAQVAKDNARYGNTVPAGSFNISAAGQEQAAANLAEKRLSAPGTYGTGMPSNPAYKGVGARDTGPVRYKDSDYLTATPYVNAFKRTFGADATLQGNRFNPADRAAALGAGYTDAVGGAINFGKNLVTGGQFKDRFNVPKLPKFQDANLQSLRNFGSVAIPALQTGGALGRFNTVDPISGKAGFANEIAKMTTSNAAFKAGKVPTLTKTGITNVNPATFAKAFTPQMVATGPTAGGSAAILGAATGVAASQAARAEESGGLNIGGSSAEGGGTGRTLGNRFLGGIDAIMRDTTDFDKRGVGNPASFGLENTVAGSVLNAAAQETGTINQFRKDTDNFSNLTNFNKLSNDEKVKTAQNVLKFTNDSQAAQALGEGLGLGKDFKTKINDAVDNVQGRLEGVTADRNSLYGVTSDFARDIGTDPDLNPINKFLTATATDNLGEAGKEKNILGMTNEMARDIKAAFQDDSPTTRGLSAEQRGIVGSVGNRLLSGKATDGLREATYGYGGREGATNAGLTEGQPLNFSDIQNTAVAMRDNLGTGTTLASQRFDEAKRLVTPGGVTAGSLIRGSIPRFGGRRGSSGSTTPTRGTGTTGTTTPMEELLIPQTPTYTAPTQTGTDTSNLQQIQQQSYMQNLAQLGITNLMQLPQFRTQQQRAPRRFRSFRRDYF